MSLYDIQACDDVLAESAPNLLQVFPGKLQVSNFQTCSTRLQINKLKLSELILLDATRVQGQEGHPTSNR